MVRLSSRHVFVKEQTKNLHDPQGIVRKLTEALATGGVAKWNRQKKKTTQQ